MSLIEKLLIRNTINSNEFLKNYFIGIFIYLGVLLALFIVNIFWPGQVSKFLVYGHTTFIFIHTIFLFPSMLSLYINTLPKAPMREKVIVVMVTNVALCIMALTISSYIFYNSN